MKYCRIKPILVLGMMLMTQLCPAAITTKDLRCEYLHDPLGIDATCPRLSWIITSNRRGEMQTAYQILVASSPELLRGGQGDLWDSGKVLLDESSQIVYAGTPLVSREMCFWKVRTWDRDGNPGDWSPAAKWSMGLLQPTDWSAGWITRPSGAPGADTSFVIHRAIYETVTGSNGVDVTAALVKKIKQGQLQIDVNNKDIGVDLSGSVMKQLLVDYEDHGHAFTREIRENQTLRLPEASWVPYLRKSFALSSPVQRAVLYVTALGLYEVHINGQRVGDHVLAPDWTDYRKRVRYQAYDVTGLLKPGNNAIGGAAGQRLVQRAHRQRRIPVFWKAAGISRPT